MNQKIFNILFNFANKNKFTKRTVVLLTKFTCDLFFIMYLIGILYLLINFNKYGFFVLFQYLFIPFISFFTARLLRKNINAKRPFEKTNIKSLVYHKGGNSFPSNHSTSAMVLAIALGYIFPFFMFLFVFLAIITGILRIMAGLHYPIDVIAGLLIGFLFGYLGFFILL